MGLYTDVIRQRDKNNRLLEEYGDQSLRENQSIYHLEDEVEDAQSAAIFLLEKLGLHVNRIYALTSVDDMIESLLGRMGMLYDYQDSASAISGRESEYILAFRSDGKAVALYPTPLGQRYYCPHDSESGYATKKYCEGLKEGCYIFQRPISSKLGALGSFMAYVLHSLNAGDLFRLVAATAAATALGWVLPEVSKWVYTSFIPKPDGAVRLLLLAMTLYLTVVLVRAAINWLKQILLSSTKVRVSMKVQSAVMARVLHMPLSFFRGTSSGRLSTRIGNSGRLTQMILELVTDVLLNLAFSAAYLFQMQSFSRALFLPAVIFLFLRILVAVISGFFDMTNSADILDVQMDTNSFLNSTVRGIQKIKSTGSEKIIYSKWTDMYRRNLSLNFEKPFFLKYSAEIMNVVITLDTIVLLRTSMLNGLSSRDYMTFVSSYTLIITTVSSLTNIMQNIFQVKTLCNNISPIFKASPDDTAAMGYIHHLKGKICADDIYFSYQGDFRGCLNGVSIDVAPGEKVAIVGESGCGKSTLLKILMGMEKPDQGTVSYDDNIMNTINMRSLRRCIGSVFQFSRLFPGTISDNICFGNAGRPDPEKIWSALDFACFGDEVRALPMQLETEISESRSSGFSGGQRQMILLARAVLNRPGVLILDEATSALDNLTQDKVLKNICSLPSTVVMVAHRLSTVEHFDRIIMMENGLIAEEGTFAELMQKKGRFAALVHKQMLQDKEE